MTSPGVGTFRVRGMNGNHPSDGMTADVVVGDGAAMTIPVPDHDPGAAWVARYDNIEAIRFTLAALLESYDFLLSDSIGAMEAERRLRLMRAVRKAMKEGRTIAAKASGAPDVNSLTDWEWQALREIARWPEGQPYFFRKASMAKLEPLGLVRRLPDHAASRPGFVITDKGVLHAQAYVVRRNSRVIGNAQGRKS